VSTRRRPFLVSTYLPRYQGEEAPSNDESIDAKKDQEPAAPDGGSRGQDLWLRSLKGGGLGKGKFHVERLKVAKPASKSSRRASDLDCQYGG
jgi:hypothetical protein